MKLSTELLNNLIEITSNSAIACYPYIGKNEKITEKKFSQDNTLYNILSTVREKINAPSRQKK